MAVHSGESSAQSSGTSANHAKMARHAGKGPARGNGNSSRPADRPAAAHNFQLPSFPNAICIQGRVYRIGLRGSDERAGCGLSDGRNPVNEVETSYNLNMQLAIFAMRLLELTFFVGLAGSTVVVLISFVEDGIELFGKDEKDHLSS